MNNKLLIDYDNIIEYDSWKDIFDSKEELEFYWWLLEAKSIGIIDTFVYQPITFILTKNLSKPLIPCESTKYKNKNKVIFRRRSYTPDFKIWIKDLKLFNTLNHKIPLFEDNFKYTGNNIIYVDVKGKFNKHGLESFVANQKWVWQKFNIYVYKIIPETFFKTTWVPERARYTLVQKKLQKKYKNFRILKDYL